MGIFGFLLVKSLRKEGEKMPRKRHHDYLQEHLPLEEASEGMREIEALSAIQLQEKPLSLPAELPATRSERARESSC
ncbi:MAG: hypothetical protein ACR2NX_04725 [Chthoniobacterales bacterium]